MSIMKLVSSAAIAAAAVGLSLGAAPSASAASGDWAWTASGYAVRSCAGSSCGSFIAWTVQYGGVQVWCYQDAGSRFFKITGTTDRGNKTGFVRAAAIPRQPVVPRC